MGKKRANQQGYKKAKDKIGRTIWVPEGGNNKHSTVSGGFESVKNDYRDNDNSTSSNINAIIRQHNGDVNDLVDKVYNHIGAGNRKVETTYNDDGSIVMTQEDYHSRAFKLEPDTKGNMQLLRGDAQWGSAPREWFNTRDMDDARKYHYDIGDYMFENQKDDPDEEDIVNFIREDLGKDITVVHNSEVLVDYHKNIVFKDNDNGNYYKIIGRQYYDEYEYVDIKEVKKYTRSVPAYKDSEDQNLVMKSELLNNLIADAMDAVDERDDTAAGDNICEDLKYNPEVNNLIENKKLNTYLIPSDDTGETAEAVFSKIDTRSSEEKQNSRYSYYGIIVEDPATGEAIAIQQLYESEGYGYLTSQAPILKKNDDGTITGENIWKITKNKKSTEDTTYYA